MTDIASRKTTTPLQDSYGSIVGELERVELQARERRLTAESEADRIRTAAHATATEIAASVPGRIRSGLVELRARHVEAAEAEVADIGERLDAAPGQPGTTPDRPVPNAAIELLVAAVLAEPTAQRTG